ncbi:E3 ubiquitin/ISG15 ligase TRIM25-like [Astyanax mexicanus]|uniref:E3 ubiquitin/ISG15 ligase TRIM25-like n=1 Tax=Astyanax mexicanus TaxID=7994 RepID=A0A8T2MSG6_ASTMX|nr:E3 ubiquitin/ISG15 ligase TRIM25-like [Astyanax mexicanus]
MAEGNISVEEQLSCSVCLDLLSDPVTVPCGHSYCLRCIRDYWDQMGPAGGCFCPQCRRRFRVRPELNRSTVLAELVEKFRESQSSSNRESAAPPEAEGVFCDVCSDGPRPAVRSCLVCLASYCETHLEPHFKSAAFRKHRLEPARGNLQARICPAHHRLYEFYCPADQRCVCYLCTVEEHKTHSPVPAETARAQREEDLVKQNRMTNQRIQRKEKECEDLKKAISTITSSADSACDETERMFRELLASIERRRVEVIGMLRAQEKTEQRRAEEVLEQAELEITNLRTRNAELEMTLQTSDHIDFLQKYQSLTHPSWTEGFTRPPNYNVTFERVTQSVSKLQKSLENICSAEISNITEKIEDVFIFQWEEPKQKAPKPAAPLNPIPEPTTREDFLHYSCFLTLKSKPEHPNLRVCEGRRAVEWVGCDSSVNTWPQVLCREGLTGRCYWEVGRSGDGVCTIGLCHGSKWKGLSPAVGLGRDAESWGLDCYQLSYVFRHDNKSISFPAPKSPPRVGVYLDHRAGTVSFYSVSDTMTLIHRVHTKFTQPLYPALALWSNGWQIGEQSYFFTGHHLTSEKGDMYLKLLNL